jgi:hypothetical protein
LLHIAAAIYGAGENNLYFPVKKISGKSVLEKQEEP